MSIRTTVEVSCDNKDCTAMGGKVTFLRYIQEEKQPPQLEKFILFQMNNKLYTLCCRRCAAEFFLPIGLEICNKKVVEFPVAKEGEDPLELPLTLPFPVNGSIPQPDGD